MNHAMLNLAEINLGNNLLIIKAFNHINHIIGELICIPIELIMRIINDIITS